MPQTALPYIHPKIDLNDLHPNGKLMADDMIKKLQTALKGQPNGRYSKAQLSFLLQSKTGETIPFPYSIIKKGGELIAIYKGKKQGKELGEGNFGVTKIQQNLITGTVDVTKVIKTGVKPDKKLMASLKGEISQLKKLGLLVTQLKNYSARKGHQLIIGMKLAEGNELWKLIEPRSPYNHFNPLQRFMMAKNLLDAAQAMHAARILHRDIKPDNFVTHPGTLDTKLIDFGIAKEVKQPSVFKKLRALVKGPKVQDNLEVKNEEAVGTPMYMAPEIKPFEPNSYNEATEVYALGMTIGDIFGLTEDTSIGMIYSQRIIDKTSVANYIQQFIRNDKLPKDPESRQQLLKLLQDMTNEVPARRPSLAQAQKQIDELLQGEYKNEFKVGVIQADEFMKLDANQRVQLIQQMIVEGVTAVAIADASQDKPDFALYQSVKKELEAQSFLNVVPVVFNGATKQELQQEAAQYFQNHFKAKPTVYEISTAVIKKDLTVPVQSSVKTSEKAAQATTASVMPPPGKNHKWIPVSLARMKGTLFASKPETELPGNQDNVHRSSKKVS